MPRIPLSQVVEQLQAHVGKQPLPKLNGPWKMSLWENVVYLADDDRRRKAFQTLKKRVGIQPEQLLSASDEALLEVTRHGILADQFAKKPLRGRPAAGQIEAGRFHQLPGA